MTKLELTKTISHQTGIDRNSVSIVVESLMREITKAIVEGEDVTLQYFGTFCAKKRASKPARDMRTNTTIMLPERIIPYFKPSSYFKQEVMESKSISKRIKNKK